MTTAIAIRAPIGDARRLLKDVVATGLVSPVLDEVVLLSDSRFTRPGDAAFTDDLGAKIWHPQPGVACVFSGRAALAELAFSRARRHFEASPGRSLEAVTAELSDCVRHTIRNVLRSPAALSRPPFWALVGVSFPGEHAKMVRFDHEDGFVGRVLPESCEIDWIGHEGVGPEFIRQLYAYVNGEEQSNAGPIGAGGEHMALMGTAILSTLISRFGGTVGGSVQVAIVERRGTHFYSVFRGDRTDGSVAPQFERVTLSFDEAQSADRGRNYLRRPPPGRVKPPGSY